MFLRHLELLQLNHILSTTMEGYKTQMKKARPSDVSEGSLCKWLQHVAMQTLHLDLPTQIPSQHPYSIGGPCHGTATGNRLGVTNAYQEAHGWCQQGDDSSAPGKSMELSQSLTWYQINHAQSRSCSLLPTRICSTCNFGRGRTWTATAWWQASLERSLQLVSDFNLPYVSRNFW